jgi:hypothetical protein
MLNRMVICNSFCMRDNAAGVLIADPARNPDFEPLVFAVIVIGDVHCAIPPSQDDYSF